MSDDEPEISDLILWGGLALVLILTVFTLLGGWGAVMGRVFGEYNEETRRIVQEESRAYQEGMAQNLDKLCLEWDRTGNPAIAQSIRHRSSGYKGELPQYVQECVDLARKVK